MKPTSSHSLNIFPSKFLEPIGFASILLLGASLRLWDLDKNGTGNFYYAAAVRSMTMNWHNFFFASFDPAGFLSIDKPPVAFWIQTAFAKILGYSGFSLILPQVLEGLCTLVVIYLLVRSRFGVWAALFSALAIALSPVSVAVDRYNYTDSCLVLILVLAAWALIRSIETGNRKLLYLSLALVGVGFNTKMMAAFVVLPVFYFVYLAGPSLSRFRKWSDLTIGTLILLAVSFSWPFAVDLTPAAQRPFVGSTLDNSEMGLSLGWNGFQRLVTRNRPDISGNSGRTISRNGDAQFKDSSSEDSKVSTSRPPLSRHWSGLNSGTPGLFRLALKDMPGQMAWFLPLALMGLWAEARRTRLTFPLSAPHSFLIFWLGWLFFYGAVFSFMRGKVHPYYLVVLVPALAALTGVGAKALWEDYLKGFRAPLLLALCSTALWQAFILSQYPDWTSQLCPILLIGTALSLGGLIISRFQVAAFGLGILTLLICPAFWALTPVLGSASSVIAGPWLLTSDKSLATIQSNEPDFNLPKLIAFLKTHRKNETYLVAALNCQTVAPIIIQTCEPAVAVGGYTGKEPILSRDEFAQRVGEGKLRYILLPQTTGKKSEIAKWVEKHGKRVDSALWEGPTPHPKTFTHKAILRGFKNQPGRIILQLYDLKPSSSH